jgi:hypothetical protein
MHMEKMVVLCNSGATLETSSWYTNVIRLFTGFKAMSYAFFYKEGKESIYGIYDMIRRNIVTCKLPN